MYNIKEKKEKLFNKLNNGDKGMGNGFEFLLFEIY